MEIIYKKISELIPYARNNKIHNDRQIKLIASSILEFGFKQPIVVDSKNSIVAGHGRLKGAKLAGLEEVPCIIADDLTKAQIKAYRIADNKLSDLAEWDNEMIGLELEELAELDFDISLTGFDIDEVEALSNVIEGSLEDVEEDEVCEKNNKAEELINNSFIKLSKEIIEQFDKIKGFSFITKHNAKINFIKFHYYNKKYNRYNSLAFHPQQFITSGDNYSTYEGLKMLNAGKIKAERLRFVTGDDVSKIIGNSLAFSGSKMPLDFPVDLTKKLIKKYCKEEGKVLDPCHGWGGRLIGFLSSKAKEYYGIDASNLQSDGVKDIYKTFKDVVDEKKVDLICSPFEKVDLKNNHYDFALTSPPYFDREKYIGGEQSHSEYSNYNHWKCGFYTTLIKNVYDSLKKDCYFALQVGSQKYPLLEDGIKIAERIGFEKIDILETDMKNNYNKTEIEKGEVILILKK